MASDALIRLSKPSPEQEMSSEQGSSTSGRRVVTRGFRGSLLPLCPGRTLDQLFSSVGGCLERWANHLAHRMGLGPHAASAKIKYLFGRENRDINV
jgi:hypothetical protein